MRELFEPKSVAIIGASERPGSLGRALAENVLSTFHGKTYLINPRGGSVLGREALRSVREVGEQIDLSLIIVPYSSVPAVLEEAGAAGSKVSIIYSGGFEEAGRGELEREILSIARKYSMRVLGPNCVGIIDTYTPINATFMSSERQGIPRAGRISLISQSGALGSLFLDYMSERLLGLRRFVSVGNAADIGLSELIDFLADDEKSDVIAVYFESMEEGRRLVEALRRAAEKKRVVVMKGGLGEGGARASSTHVAALAKPRRLIEGALRQTGAFLAGGVDEFIASMEALARSPSFSEGFAIVTNSGGMGVILSDALEERGQRIARLSEELLARIKPILPPYMAINNPIDLSGGATSELYQKVIDALGDLPLVIVNQPQTAAMDSENFVALSEKVAGRPAVFLVAGGSYARLFARELRKRGVPVAESPREAAAMVSALMPKGRGSPLLKLGGREAFLEAVRKGYLLESDAKSLLRSYGIATPRGVVVRSPQEAREAAELFGTAIMKILSPDVMHKTEIGGVIRVTPETAAEAFERLEDIAKRRGLRFSGALVEEVVPIDAEIAMGAMRDEHLGVVIFLGIGGFLIELIEGVSFRLFPASIEDVREMIRETKIWKLVEGYRGVKISEWDVAAALASVGSLVYENPEILEVDVNPLAISRGSLVALDAKIRVTAL